MRIVILGGGTAGWMAASCMARVLGTRTHSITLVESSEIPTVGVGEATIPMIDSFHRIVGLTPIDIVQKTQATFKLGIEFVDWTRKNHSYFHPFGAFGSDMNGISFTHYWLRQQQRGKAQPAGDYNAETVAAYAGKFSFQPPQKPGDPRINHAYHFDAGLYALMLRELAESLDVKRIDSKMTGVLRDAESGNVTSLMLENGTQVDGDLFIDCSGFRGLLIGQQMNVEYVDWKKYLPCDSALAIPSERHENLPPYTRATARDAGWQWRIPLQNRTGNGYVYSSEFTDTETAKRDLLDGLDRPPIDDPREIKFTTGYRPRMWEKNVVALGLAAGFLEPLESTSIFFIQSALTKLMLMFPRGEIVERSRNKFNESMVMEYFRVRDFLIAHYNFTEREDTEFWKYCRNIELPDSLKEYIDFYQNDAIFLERTFDLFREASWFAVLNGQGLTPTHYHPVADAADDASLDKQMEHLLNVVNARVDGLPTHNDFIASCLNAGSAK